MPISFCRLLMLCAGLALLGSGCDGQQMATVSGSVTVDGQVPAEGASITFIPVDGKGVSAGQPLNQGKYSVKVPVGKMRVEIRCPKPMGKKAGTGVAGPGPGPGGSGWIEESLPAEYHEKSTLTLDVKAGSQEKNWECQTKK